MADTLFQDVLTAVQAEFTDLTVTSDATSISVVDPETGGEWRMSSVLTEDRVKVTANFTRAGMRQGFFTLNSQDEDFASTLSSKIQDMRQYVNEGRQQAADDASVVTLRADLEANVPDGYSLSGDQNEDPNVLIVRKEGSGGAILLRLFPAKVLAVLWKGGQSELAADPSVIWAAMDDMFVQLQDIRTNKRSLMQTRLDAKTASRVAAGLPAPTRRIDFTEAREKVAKVRIELANKKAEIAAKVTTLQARDDRQAAVEADAKSKSKQK